MIKEDHLDLAVSHFATAERLAQSERGLRVWRDRARGEGRRAGATKEIRDQADELFASGDRLRFSLLGFRGDPKTSYRWVVSALG